MQRSKQDISRIGDRTSTVVRNNTPCKTRAVRKNGIFGEKLGIYYSQKLDT